MAKSFKEFGETAESLIEQGKEADQKVQSCQARVASANNRVAAARRQLAAASQTDEDGNPIGNVEHARAQLNIAENQLAASQRALSSARSDADRVRQQKNAHVQEIERHNQIERSNLEKLRRLRSSAFGGNSAVLTEGMAQRLNEAEDARVELLRSMGIDAAPDHVAVGGEGSVDAGWRGGGFAAIDTIGQAQSYQGGGSEGIRIGQETSDARTLLGRLFGKSKSEHSGRTLSLNFNGFSLESNGMAGERYFVKGNNYNKFIHFWHNPDQYSFTNTKCKKTINVCDIEGIYLNDSEAQDPHLFWNRGQEYAVDSEIFFMEIATRIPEVRTRLEAGESVDSIRNDPNLKICYDFYFDTPISVYEVDDYYYFAGAGRHRCMAAQKLGYDIPVNVIGRYEKKSGNRIDIPDNLRLLVQNYSAAFIDTEQELKNTQRLVDYVNLIEKSDKRVVNLFNNIGQMENLQQQGIQFKITHDKNHALNRYGINYNGKIKTTEMVLNVPKLSGEDITGQVQTTLHEQMHFVDQLMKNDVSDFCSPGFAAANIGMREALQNTTSEVSEDVKVLFSNHAKQLNELNVSLRSQYELTVRAAKEQFLVDGDFGAYLAKVDKAKEDLDTMSDYDARNLMRGGIGQLEDIYDALSCGKYFDSGLVSFGHGSEYYSSVESRIDEIIANYASLSVTRPDLISLLRRDKPGLVSSLDKIIDLMNERVMKNG